jgi:hypothetical protein
MCRTWSYTFEFVCLVLPLLLFSHLVVLVLVLFALLRVRRRGEKVSVFETRGFICVSECMRMRKTNISYRNVINLFLSAPFERLRLFYDRFLYESRNIVSILSSLRSSECDEFHCSSYGRFMLIFLFVLCFYCSIILFQSCIVCTKQNKNECDRHTWFSIFLVYLSSMSMCNHDRVLDNLSICDQCSSLILSIVWQYSRTTAKNKRKLNEKKSIKKIN